MSILVIAEHDNKSIKSSTLTTIGAAQKLGTDINLVILGTDCKALAEKCCQISGISKVLWADSDIYSHPIAEYLATVIAEMASPDSHILAPATSFGKNLMPQIAALLDVQQISDVIRIDSSDTFQRPVYGGQAIATVQSKDAKKVLTIRGTAFPAVEETGGNAKIENIMPHNKVHAVKFLNLEETKSERPELTAAKIVVSGGRGVGSKENFSIIEKLADKIGAAVGASRAAVDAGYAPNDYQVGQTGKVVAPNLYLAIGISGAIQHLAGMKDSKIIVAINKDGEAPIFQVADYGLVGDLFQIVPELQQKL